MNFDNYTTKDGSNEFLLRHQIPEKVSLDQMIMRIYFAPSLIDIALGAKELGLSPDLVQIENLSAESTLALAVFLGHPVPKYLFSAALISSRFGLSYVPEPLQETMMAYNYYVNKELELSSDSGDALEMAMHFWKKIIYNKRELKSLAEDWLWHELLCLYGIWDITVFDNFVVLFSENYSYVKGFQLAETVLEFKLSPDGDCISCSIGSIAKDADALIARVHAELNDAEAKKYAGAGTHTTVDDLWVLKGGDYVVSPWNPSLLENYEILDVMVKCTK